MATYFNSHKLTRIAIQVFSFLFLLGCLGRIDIDTDPLANQLVVSGQVSPVEEENLVELGRTAGTGRLPFPLVGASVILHDDAGNSYTWNEYPEHPGQYKPIGFSGVPGRTYHIQIILPEGDVYESDPETMPEHSGTDALRYAFEEEEFIDAEGIVSNLPFIKIYTNATLPDSNAPMFARWSVIECYAIRPTDFPDPFGNVPPPCYVTQAADPQRIVLLNGTELNNPSVENLLLCSRLIDRSFFERHYFTVYQSSMSEQAYDYWRKVNIVANQVGSIFDTPPAAIKGNISKVGGSGEPVLGYFQAVNQTYNRFFLLPGDIPFQIPYTSCLYDPFKSGDQYPGECLDCISVRNSSHVRPDWF
jgi:hypothetical protein